MVYPNLIEELTSKIDPEPLQPIDENLSQAVQAIVSLAEKGFISTEQRDRLIGSFVAAIVAHKVEGMIDDLTDAVLSLSSEHTPGRIRSRRLGYPHRVPSLRRSRLQRS